MANTYITENNDTIIDVAYNTTGSIYAIDRIMDDNDIDSYHVIFDYGRHLDISLPIQNNAAILRSRRIPYNSTFLPEADTIALIDEFINIIS